MSHDGEPLIDLHGQHAAEGVAMLRRELARLRSSQQQHQPSAAQQTIYVLVGTGHHTKVRLCSLRRSASAPSYHRAPDGTSHLRHAKHTEQAH